MKSSIRSATSLVTALGFVLSATTANALSWSFVGKFTSNRGRIINIPAVGITPCNAAKELVVGGAKVQSLTVMTGTQKGIPMTMTLTPIPWVRKVNTQPAGKTAGGQVIFGMDLQCVPNNHLPAKKIVTTGTMAMTGAAFTLPDHIWNAPLPGTLPAVEVKYITAIAQLATSFKITGPQVLSMIMSARAPGTMVATSMNMASTSGGTRATAGNLGPWLKFQKLAAVPAGMRSGRVVPAMVPTMTTASGKFTWCPGGTNPVPPFTMFQDCVNVGQAPAGTKAIIKYTGGGNQFGGTMSYIITTGGSTSSLALNPAGSTGAAAFLVLAGSGSQPTGRGYAQLGSDMLMTGPQFSMHKEMVTVKPRVGAQKLFTMVSNPVAPFPAAYNFNYGFPFTTMKVIARNTGTALGNPMVTTVTAQGKDTVTAMGLARNIQLVAGGIGITNLLGLGSQTPEIASMVLPEPSRVLQMLAGVVALLGMAGWRARKN